MKYRGSFKTRAVQTSVRVKHEWEKCFLCERKLINHTEHWKLCLYIMSFDGYSYEPLNSRGPRKRLACIRFLQSWQPFSESLTLQVTWWQGGWATGRHLGSPCEPRGVSLPRLWQICWDQWDSAGTGCSSFICHLPNLSTCSSQILQSSEHDTRLSRLGKVKECSL